MTKRVRNIIADLEGQYGEEVSVIEVHNAVMYCKNLTAEEEDALCDYFGVETCGRYDYEEVR